MYSDILMHFCKSKFLQRFNTVNPHYTNTRYKDKTHYNFILNGANPWLKMRQIEILKNMMLNTSRGDTNKYTQHKLLGVNKIKNKPFNITYTTPDWDSL